MRGLQTGPFASLVALRNKACQPASSGLGPGLWFCSAYAANSPAGARARVPGNVDLNAPPEPSGNRLAYARRRRTLGCERQQRQRLAAIGQLELRDNRAAQLRRWTQALRGRDTTENEVGVQDGASRVQA